MSLGGVTQVIPSVVISNGMFSGMRFDGISVRGANELGSFVTDGKWRIGTSEVRMWQGEHPSEAELASFFDRDTFHSPIWGAMDSFVEMYKFGNLTVHVPAFRLNMLKLAQSLEMPEAVAQIAGLQRDLKQKLSALKMTRHSRVSTTKMRRKEKNLARRRKKRK